MFAKALLQPRPTVCRRNHGVDTRRAHVSVDQQCLDARQRHSTGQVDGDIGRTNARRWRANRQRPPTIAKVLRQQMRSESADAFALDAGSILQDRNILGKPVFRRTIIDCSVVIDEGHRVMIVVSNVVGLDTQRLCLSRTETEQTGNASASDTVRLPCHDPNQGDIANPEIVSTTHLAAQQFNKERGEHAKR